MIDDRGPKQRRPTVAVSFSDLEALGFKLYVEEYIKTKPDGSEATACKIVKVTKGDKEFPRHMMMEFLRVFGINTEERVWVTPRRKHRCLSQKTPVYNWRYQGFERDDDTWLRSGRASMDIIMWSSNMKDMQEQADKLSNGGDD